MMDRRLIEHFDWALFFIMITLMAIGLINLYSATYYDFRGQRFSPYFIRQVMWVILGCLAFLAVLMIDYHHLQNYAVLIYSVGIILLILVLCIGQSSHGAQRWLGVGSVRFQPSEIEKIIIAIAVAAWAASDRIPLYPSFLEVAFLVLINVPVFVLIAMQPDLGTALLVCLVAGTVVFTKGIRKSWFVGGMVCLALLAYPVWEKGLKDYQRNRILAAINPDRDPQRTGYHARQARIAIGSGMIWGRGYLKGTQNKLKFLPEKHTDFAFAVWAEEWGFMGSVVLLCLYGLFLYRCFMSIFLAKDAFGTFLCVGLTAIFMWEILINLGMVIGILPVVGVPLPFMSYGGSSVLKAAVAVGLMESVTMRRYTFRSL